MLTQKQDRVEETTFYSLQDPITHEITHSILRDSLAPPVLVSTPTLCSSGMTIEIILFFILNRVTSLKINLSNFMNHVVYIIPYIKLITRN